MEEGDDEQIIVVESDFDDDDDDGDESDSSDHDEEDNVDGIIAHDSIRELSSSPSYDPISPSYNNMDDSNDSNDLVSNVNGLDLSNLNSVSTNHELESIKNRLLELIVKVVMLPIRKLFADAYAEFNPGRTFHILSIESDEGFRNRLKLRFIYDYDDNIPELRASLTQLQSIYDRARELTEAHMKSLADDDDDEGDHKEAEEKKEREEKAPIQQIQQTHTQLTQKQTELIDDVLKLWHDQINRIWLKSDIRVIIGVIDVDFNSIVSMRNYLIRLYDIYDGNEQVANTFEHILHLFKSRHLLIAQLKQEDVLDNVKAAFKKVSPSFYDKFIEKLLFYNHDVSDAMTWMVVLLYLDLKQLQMIINESRTMYTSTLPRDRVIPIPNIKVIERLCKLTDKSRIEFILRLRNIFSEFVISYDYIVLRDTLMTLVTNEWITNEELLAIANELDNDERKEQEQEEEKIDVEGDGDDDYSSSDVDSDYTPFSSPSNSENEEMEEKKEEEEEQDQQIPYNPISPSYDPVPESDAIIGNVSMDESKEEIEIAVALPNYMALPKPSRDEINKRKEKSKSNPLLLCFYLLITELNSADYRSDLDSFFMNRDDTIIPPDLFEIYDKIKPFNKADTKLFIEQMRVLYDPENNDDPNKMEDLADLVDAIRKKHNDRFDKYDRDILAATPAVILLPNTYNTDIYENSYGIINISGAPPKSDIPSPFQVAYCFYKSDQTHVIIGNGDASSNANDFLEFLKVTTIGYYRLQQIIALAMTANKVKTMQFPTFLSALAYYYNFYPIKSPSGNNNIEPKHTIFSDAVFKLHKKRRKLTEGRTKEFSDSLWSMIRRYTGHEYNGVDLVKYNDDLLKILYMARIIFNRYDEYKNLKQDLPPTNDTTNTTTTATTDENKDDALSRAPTTILIPDDPIEKQALVDEIKNTYETYPHSDSSVSVLTDAIKRMNSIGENIQLLEDSSIKQLKRIKSICEYQIKESSVIDYNMERANLIASFLERNEDPKETVVNALRKAIKITSFSTSKIGKDISGLLDLIESQKTPEEKTKAYESMITHWANPYRASLEDLNDLDFDYHYHLKDCVIYSQKFKVLIQLYTRLKLCWDVIAETDKYLEDHRALYFEVRTLIDADPDVESEPKTLLTLETCDEVFPLLNRHLASITVNKLLNFLYDIFIQQFETKSERIGLTKILRGPLGKFDVVEINRTFNRCKYYHSLFNEGIQYEVIAEHHMLIKHKELFSTAMDNQYLQVQALRIEYISWFIRAEKDDPANTRLDHQDRLVLYHLTELVQLIDYIYFRLGSNGIKLIRYRWKRIGSIVDNIISALESRYKLNEEETLIDFTSDQLLDVLCSEILFNDTITSELDRYYRYDVLLRMITLTRFRDDIKKSVYVFPGIYYQESISSKNIQNIIRKTQLPYKLPSKYHKAKWLTDRCEYAIAVIHACSSMFSRSSSFTSLNHITILQTWIKRITSMKASRTDKNQLSTFYQYLLKANEVWMNITLDKPSITMKESNPFVTLDDLGGGVLDWKKLWIIDMLVYLSGLIDSHYQFSLWIWIEHYFKKTEQHPILGRDELQFELNDGIMDHINKFRNNATKSMPYHKSLYHRIHFTVEELLNLIKRNPFMKLQSTFEYKTDTSILNLPFRNILLAFGDIPNVLDHQAERIAELGTDRTYSLMSWNKTLEAVMKSTDQDPDLDISPFSVIITSEIPRAQQLIDVSYFFNSTYELLGLQKPTEDYYDVVIVSPYEFATGNMYSFTIKLQQMSFPSILENDRELWIAFLSKLIYVQHTFYVNHIPPVLFSSSFNSYLNAWNVRLLTPNEYKPNEYPPISYMNAPIIIEKEKPYQFPAYMNIFIREWDEWELAHHNYIRQSTDQEMEYEQRTETKQEAEDNNDADDDEKKTDERPNSKRSRIGKKQQHHHHHSMFSSKGHGIEFTAVVTR